MPINVQLKDPTKPIRATFSDVMPDYPVQTLMLHGDEVVAIPDPVPDRIHQLIGVGRLIETKETPHQNLLGPLGFSTAPVPPPPWRDPGQPDHPARRVARVAKQEVMRLLGPVRGTTGMPQHAPGVGVVYVSRDGRFASLMPIPSDAELEADEAAEEELVDEGDTSTGPDTSSRPKYSPPTPETGPAPSPDDTQEQNTGKGGSK